MWVGGGWRPPWLRKVRGRSGAGQHSRPGGGEPGGWGRGRREGRGAMEQGCGWAAAKAPKPTISAHLSRHVGRNIPTSGAQGLHVGGSLGGLRTVSPCLVTLVRAGRAPLPAHLSQQHPQQECQPLLGPPGRKGLPWAPGDLEPTPTAGDAPPRRPPDRSLRLSP